MSIATVGGVIGIVIGLLGLVTLSAFMKLPSTVIWQPMLLSFLSAILVGLVAGIQPARKAAAVNPIEALK